MEENKKNNKQNNLTIFNRLFFMLFIVVVLCLIFYLFIIKTGVWNKVNSIDKIRKIVEAGGVFSCLIFIILQILQTTILQIPAVVVTVAGTLIFGRWTAFFLSYIAVMLGSVIMFWIGRKAGRKFLNLFVCDEKLEKWVDRLSHGKYLFALMMLFPLFPDDILCLVAGLTNMSFKFFLCVNLVARGIGIACTVFFGSGAVIPFSGWGLAVWVIVIAFIVLLFYFSVKFQDKIDDVVNNWSKKRKS